MMEALVAGGMDAVSAIPPFFEHNILPVDEGKLVKPVRTDCARWPAGDYKVVFMRRDPQEQHDSRVAAFPKGGSGSVEYIKTATKRRLRVLQERGDCEVIELWYGDVLADPEAAFVKVAGFFGVELDVAAAAGVVDPAKRHYG